MAETLAHGDIFLAPSVTGAKGNEEGIPNAIKEAMAVGVPVVASRHGGIPELLEDGHNGRLVSERDPAALAAAVSDLLVDAQRRDRYTEAARATIEAHYESDTLNDQLAALYERVRRRESVN